MDSPIYNSPIMDYLYVRASSAYMAEVGIPDPYIRNIWISDYIQNEIEWFDKQISSIQEDIQKLKADGILH